MRITPINAGEVSDTIAHAATASSQLFHTQQLPDRASSNSSTSNLGNTTMSLQQTQQPTTPTSPTLVHSRDTYLSACTSVPEDEVLRSEPASSIGLPRLQQPGFETEAKPKKGLAALLAGCSCLGGGGTRMVVEEKEGGVFGTAAVAGALLWTFHSACFV